ncbi:pantoate--beta-alanine ligase [Frigidibacter sp. RF13]|uniref:pantoate--beta-alanine ligase n=1 Tax=Frigidibacter sp. RF13 TaxID=2997340 RepID=UPI00226F2E04|nr:pantoate--beta-alanine ligase [Frigidibacter sp. RF13]MCY1126877.1 pantoate--beta-alanine ligase [Frigidibacter sp. RF13]
MRTIRDLAVLRTRVRDWREAGESVAVVPTMGALHEGHLSLVAAAKAACDRVIVTLFVNPKQFNNPQDLARYPRTEATDAALLQPLGIDVLFAPEASAVYPEGFLTKVTVAHLQDVLCGAHRPGHFDGVATVVTKLLLMTGADIAFFGEKDWQQLQIIRRLVEDLNIPVDVVGCPTLREKDGLAMSSRNQRLSKADRARAPALHAAMAEAAVVIRAAGDVAAALSAARGAILKAGFAEVEYLELRHSATLEPLDRAAPEARLFAAAWIGGVRLIDNIALF